MTTLVDVLSLFSLTKQKTLSKHDEIIVPDDPKHKYADAKYPPICNFISMTIDKGKNL
ncbi:hypothetical protein [Pseudoalteromonas aurantia]|uniref:hypothetical protein n=1 Tax=Pseudoalteromonas aurantia TaxID=43654 RepID=UPI00148724F9|nr:hypothetical protein [Pseudoalteromonas aurantia]